MSSSEEFPKPSLAVDTLVLYWNGTELQLPLIQRGGEPFKGAWAFPGGFMQIDETLERAAHRELGEETGLRIDKVSRGPIFDAVERDPRGRVISVPHVALVNGSEVEVRAASDAAGGQLFRVGDLPDDLAFDHADMWATMRVFAADEVEAGRLGPELNAEDRT
ncbi:MAG: NUDIX hydrolase, partial [Chloroflexota bacterium]|nr:NUDIX hydrolase [Chloroflexota bacterium]